MQKMRHLCTYCVHVHRMCVTNNGIIAGVIIFLDIIFTEIEVDGEFFSWTSQLALTSVVATLFIDTLWAWVFTNMGNKVKFLFDCRTMWAGICVVPARQGSLTLMLPIQRAAPDVSVLA